MMVRDERPEDRPAIRAVVAAAFARSLEADLVDRLRSDGDSVISLVALDAGRMVGHVMFSRMAAPFRALGLAPVAVVPDRQRRGIGSRLIRDGLERAAAGGWQGVFVFGEPRYYHRFGFQAALAQGFGSPYAGPHLMALALAGSLPATTGRIDPAAAFRCLD
jgi:putative acetyltransferase